MPPKKKANKKANDDWEAELGESAAPQPAAGEPKPEEAAPEDEAPTNDLMAAIQRRRKNKKNKAENQDFVEGEDPTADTQTTDLASKAPEEANFDDEDVFAGNYGKKKGKAAAETKEEPKEEEKADDGAGRVKTKAEKEKEKKEKEKQRKKELVGLAQYLPQQC